MSAAVPTERKRVLLAPDAAAADALVRPTSQVVILCRHADRHDYAHPRWVRIAETTGGRPRDPPLSALGHDQAEALADALASVVRARGGACRVVTSPYLRCLQTAAPLCRRLSLELCVDDALAEVRHKPSHVAPLAERRHYFPFLHDDDEQHAGPRHAASPRVDDVEEDWPVGYLRRVRAFAARLRRDLDAPDAPATTILFSHAASVALVACLTNEPLSETLAFAPAGAYALARPLGKGRPAGSASKDDANDDPSSSSSAAVDTTVPRATHFFAVVRAGDTNAPYVAENSTTARSWSFSKDRLRQWSDAHGGARFPFDQTDLDATTLPN